MFVGRRTRSHKDLDVSMNQKQRAETIKFMLDCGWRVFEPDDGALFEILCPDADRRRKANIWCIKENNNDYILTGLGENRFHVTQMSTEQKKLDYIEFLFNAHENGCFLYGRNHDIRLPLSHAFRYFDGIPYLAPELVLLYKSSFVRALAKGGTEGNPAFIKEYRDDFAACLPYLNPEQKLWLKEALEQEYHGKHEWLPALSPAY